MYIWAGKLKSSFEDFPKNRPHIMYLQVDTSKFVPHRIDPWPSTVMQAMCKCSILFVKCFNNDVIGALDNKAIKAKIYIYVTYTSMCQ